MATTKIKPNDVPLDKIDAVIERLQREKEARINAKVEAGEAVRVNVSVVGDEDVEAAKQKALRDYSIPPDKPVHFVIFNYRYPEFCSDGVTPNPMNGPVPDRTGADPPIESLAASQSRRYPDTDYSRYKPPEPQELIVGEPRPV